MNTWGEDPDQVKNNNKRLSNDDEEDDDDNEDVNNSFKASANYAITLIDAHPTMFENFLIANNDDDNDYYYEEQAGQSLMTRGFIQPTM